MPSIAAAAQLNPAYRRRLWEHQTIIDANGPMRNKLGSVMTVHFTLATKSDDLFRLVGDFAQGLGCTLQEEPIVDTLRAEVPDGAETLLNLITFVALSAMKCGVALDEPLCEVTYRQGAASEVTLALRIADIRLHGPAST